MEDLHGQDVVEEICETTLTIAYHLGRLFFTDGDSILPSKFFILLAVSRNGPCMISQIAEQVGLSSSANTIAVNKLVKEGLLKRVKDKNDKRICWIQITPSGQSVLDEMIGKRNRVFQSILEDFSEAHLSIFLRSLESIQDKFALESHESPAANAIFIRE
ncbi:DNA-binding MarR family transcriptional regulator [Fontibacillus phaseoli]|uniref:DNA-binding MarR family transcriptional regulator n=1 Tax=Fontibacillus phaseoli TaxID=1416533 RepID=A0A369BKT4_9BACL|nr:MarR family transcriptional regulator [Fontibacillus phaseoli]RCX21745.1 DNA-binding MarR family transcriptional regulator [Fontibacillus phaseoli]